MRAALVSLALVLTAPAALGAPAGLVPECNAGVCVAADDFSGSCDTFYLEFVRVLAHGVLVYHGRWCGEQFNGMRADVQVAPASTEAHVVWGESGPSCDTYVWYGSPVANAAPTSYGCPAGTPPPLPPVVGLLP